MIRGLGLIKKPLKELGGVEYYRTYLPLREASRYDEEIDLTIIDIKGMKKYTNAQMLKGQDFILVSRMYANGYKKFVDTVHKAGKFILFDVDDDLITFLGPRKSQPFKDMLGEVDFVSVTSDYLAKKLSEYTQRLPVVIENFIDYDWFTAQADSVKRFVPGLTVGYTGTRWHWWDWFHTAGALKDLEDIQPLAQGADVDYLDNYIDGLWKLTPQVPYAGYPQMLSQFDIVMCPLEPTDFNRCKSAIKAVEAMTVGAIPVCSNIEPYRNLKEAGAPIVMVNDEKVWKEAGDVESLWREPLKELRDNKEFRLSLSKAGKVWVKAHRDIKVGWKKWAKYFHNSYDTHLTASVLAQAGN